MQKVVRAKDADGEHVDTWPNDDATVWASIQPMDGRELTEARQVQMSTTHNIVMRYGSDVVPEAKDRVKWVDARGTRIFNIKSVVNMDERREQLMLKCEERV